MIKKAVMAGAFILLAAAADAGELMIHPQRIVFEGNQRTAAIDVINSGTEAMTYRISLVQRRMTETGDFVEISEADRAPGESFAGEMIRFSPRQVLLRPGLSQTVRMQLRRPAGLAEGEYRSHLHFQALPTGAPAAAGSDGASQGFDIRLIPIYGLSIPVIVRHGNTSAALSIEDLALRRSDEDSPALAMTLRRSGNRSVYGDLTVYFTPATGKERVIGRANGVAVYTPNAIRRAVVPLPALRGGIPPGELRVTFAERPGQTGKVEVGSRITVP